MVYFITCFLAGLVLTLLVLRSTRWVHFSVDHDLAGVQKFHARAVPRVGGLGIFMAWVIGCVVAEALGVANGPLLWQLLVCAIPAFGAGLIEDLTKTVRPRWRLLATVASAALTIWMFGSFIERTDIPGLDELLTWTPLAVALTLLTVAGVSNSINIIDGFNGLASMCAFMMVLAMGYVAFQVGDDFVFAAALMTAGATLGFFMLNFPAGLIFLGDGGAYLLGFLLAELGILVVHRNPAVSPIFPVLLCAYPIFEMIFSVYRRKLVRGVPSSSPDGIHLHTLIHRRLIRWTLRNNFERRRLTRRNSMTSPYLWMLCLTSVIPSVLWWNNTAVLSSFLLAFVLLYVWMYARIVRFRTPRWMIFRRET